MSVCCSLPLRVVCPACEQLKGQKRELLETVEADKFGGDKNAAARQVRRLRNKCGAARAVGA